MRLLVVGANGLLGSNVVVAGGNRGWDVIATYHTTEPDFDVPLTQFDLQAHSSFDDVLDTWDPDVVVNCAAMTDVDGCEGDHELAHLLNAEAPGGLAKSCESFGVSFVHVSTDYVFDGSGRRPYSESARPNPLQAYGESKLAGERLVRAESESALLLRLSFVWGVHRSHGELSGFPAWVRSGLESEDALPLFTDQWVTPTRAGQAADVLCDLVEADASGMFHVACTSCVTPFEFGALIARILGSDTEPLVEGSTDNVERDAARPTYTCLDSGKVESALNRSQPTLREDTEAVGDAL